jgi:hypothetical protein
MKTYFDIHLFTHFIPLDGHNVTCTKCEFNLILYTLIAVNQILEYIRMKTAGE